MHGFSAHRPKLVFFFYFFVVFLLIAIAIYSNWQVLFTPTNIDQVAQAYSQSQYVLGEGSPQKIDDGTVYLYAGYAYLQGENPTTVNFEQPPLGKYIFGVSYRLFHSSYVLNLLVFLGILVTFIVLARQIGLSHLYTLLSLVCLALTTSLNHHVGMALLDSMILFCSLFFFTVLLSSRRTLTYGLLLGLALGCLMSIKYPFPLILVYYAVVIVWFWWQKKWRPLLIALPVSFLIYLLTYTFFFFDQKTPLDFIKFEWYRYKWWTGDRTMPKFLILQTLFFGKFKAWWETSSLQYISDGDWHVSWPILFVLSLFASFKAVVSQNKKQLIIAVYSLLLLAAYAFGSASFGRYLLQLVPMWILLIAALIQSYFTTNKKPHGTT